MSGRQELWRDVGLAREGATGSGSGSQRSARASGPVTGMAGGASLLLARDVEMAYARRGDTIQALSPTTLEVAEGSFTALVGPSGCGKSTLLLILAGMLRPTGGQVMLLGHPLDRPSDKIGLALQSPALLPWKTVLENVMLAATLGAKRSARDSIKERARSLLTVAGIDGFRDHYPRQLSGGMRQRVAICRALVLDPPILLMDEPFVALDALTREALNAWFEDLWQRTRKGVVWVTHSIDEAVVLADEVVVMSPRPGRIVARVAIDLPRPRGVDVMTTAAFAGLCGEVRRCLGTSLPDGVPVQQQP